MSHGKVIKNRSSGQPHSLKVYMIYIFATPPPLFVLALLSLLCVYFFVCVSLPLSPCCLRVCVCVCFQCVYARTLRKSTREPVFKSCSLHNSDSLALHWRLNLGCVSSRAVVFTLHQRRKIVIWRESKGPTFFFFLMNTGVMFIFCCFVLFFGGGVQHPGRAYREQYICFVVMPPPLPHTHIQKNAVYKIFSYSQGALSRLLEASALIA